MQVQLISACWGREQGQNTEFSLFGRKYYLYIACNRPDQTMQFFRASQIIQFILPECFNNDPLW